MTDGPRPEDGQAMTQAMTQLTQLTQLIEEPRPSDNDPVIDPVVGEPS